MTKLASASDRAGRAAPAPPQSPAGNRQRSPAGALADPRVRLAAGTAVILATAIAARRHRVGPGETAAFRVVNGLPDALYRPAWIIMQLGTLGAAPAAAAVAWLAGDRKLAGRLLAGGTGTWAASKLVKRMVRRPRPATLLPGTHRRGPDAAGLGYLSGHAGVAVALGAAALPHLGPAGRALTLAAIATVGLTRIYVGAHLPLDTAGGAALGLAMDAALALTQEYSTASRGTGCGARYTSAIHALGGDAQQQPVPAPCRGFPDRRSGAKVRQWRWLLPPSSPTMSAASDSGPRPGAGGG